MPFLVFAILLLLTAPGLAQDGIWIPQPSESQHLVADADQNPALLDTGNPLFIQLTVVSKGDHVGLGIALLNTSGSTVVVPESALSLPSELRSYTTAEILESLKDISPLPYVAEPGSVDMSYLQNQLNEYQTSVFFQNWGGGTWSGTANTRTIQSEISKGISAYAMGARIRQLNTLAEVRKHNAQVAQINSWIEQENRRRREARATVGEILPKYYWKTMAIEPGQEVYRVLLCKPGQSSHNELTIGFKIEDTTSTLRFRAPQ